MKPIVQCRVTDKGIHSFYIKTEQGTYFLFNQNYRKGVSEYFQRGVVLDDALNCSKCYYNTALVNTKKKLAPYIKYIEKEYNIVILEKTRKKKRGINGRESLLTIEKILSFNKELLSVI